MWACIGEGICFLNRVTSPAKSFEEREREREKQREKETEGQT